MKQIYRKMKFLEFLIYYFYAFVYPERKCQMLHSSIQLAMHWFNTLKFIH